MTDPVFVSTEWLAASLGAPDLSIVDGSTYLPTANRNARAEFLAGHIPGAVFFDIEELSDPSTGLPHMLIGPEEFGRAAGHLGIANGKRIVVYDGDGLFSAPRVRWNFQIMGAKEVYVLEGGLPKWVAEGRPLETGPAAPAPKIFTAQFDPSAVVDLAYMRNPDRQVVDARPAGRFTGEVPEPRAGMRSGHMPGAKSAPLASLKSADGIMKSAEELRAQFEAAGIDLTQPIVTSCGSGVTAVVLKVALERAGAKDVVVYDGSWSEWGGREDTEVVTGSA
ncbi:MAG: 3-mercaptopyruvate sulfurtransferase [Devosia sp.]